MRSRRDIAIENVRASALALLSSTVDEVDTSRALDIGTVRLALNIIEAMDKLQTSKVTTP